MRMVATAPEAVREETSLRRFMLVTRPQPGQRYGRTLDTDERTDSREGTVIVYAYIIEEDGPSYEPWGFTGIEAALSWLVDNGIGRLDWREVPDQVPGCRDDWIEAVRLDGGRWKRLADGEWVEFDGPPGGYRLHIG